MNGSTGGIFPDWLTHLFSSGAASPTSNLVGGASGGADILPGPDTSYAATTPQQAQSALQAVQGGSGPSSKDLVSALQGAGKGVSGMQEQQMRPNVSTPMTSSQAVPGRGQDLGTLLQLLQQRQQGYGMGSSQSSGGLLGVR